MNRLTRLMIGIAVAAIAAPASAQLGSDGDKFVTMVRDGENGAALALLQSKPTIIDATDARGDTALLVAVKSRDSAWTAHLIKTGADPNLAARNGDTPLITAARAGFADAVRWLIGAGAKVDGTNRMGETALIVAVQEHDVPLVRLLLRAGADPDWTDAAAGFSARDYARRETRYPDLLETIEASKRTAPATAKPASDNINDFKLN